MTSHPILSKLNALMFEVPPAVGELSVLGCRAPQPREGNLATCQGLSRFGTREQLQNTHRSLCLLDLKWVFTATFCTYI